MNDFLRTYAHQIWERIHFSWCRNQRISETTITENMIFDFWHKVKENKLPIKIYEAKEEYRNGNDLEVFVETKRGFLLLVCQAKIISKKGNYLKITHKINHHYQIDSLIDYAKQRGGESFYIFYNYVSDFMLKRKLKESKLFEAEDYGLTYCSANYIKKNYFNLIPGRLGKTNNRIPRFEQLHPEYALPLFSLISMLREDFVSDLLYEAFQQKATPFKLYTLREILDDHSFENIIPLMKVSGVSNLSEEELFEPEIKQKPKEARGYNPKYRIVFTLQ
jgi:hypothetical protein